MLPQRTPLEYWLNTMCCYQGKVQDLWWCWCFLRANTAIKILPVFTAWHTFTQWPLTVSRFVVTTLSEHKGGDFLEWWARCEAHRRPDMLPCSPRRRWRRSGSLRTCLDTQNRACMCEEGAAGRGGWRTGRLSWSSGFQLLQTHDTVQHS